MDNIDDDFDDYAVYDDVNDNFKDEDIDEVDSDVA